MADAGKDDLYEMQRPVDGEHSPKSNLDEDVGWAIKPGNEQDDLDMRRMGQKQQLSRSFRSLSILGLTTIVTNTWLAWLSASTFALYDGGRGGAIYSYIGSWVLSFLTVLSLAEMASMAPTSGGQYHWVSEFAPPSVQKPLSYLSGWLAGLGWQAFIAAASYASGNLILILAQTAHPSYTPTAWQGTLMTILMAVSATLFVTFAAKALPFFEGCILFFDVMGVFAIMIPLWCLAPMASSHEVWGEFGNLGGWNTLGLAILVGQVPAGGALIGFDAAAHMAEEVRNASFTVPWMMVLSILLNGIVGFALMLTYLYSIQDVTSQIYNSTAVYPFIQVLEFAVGSKGGAIGMMVPFVILSYCVAINALGAGSRQAWAFSRDGGLPFPNWWAKVRVINKTPTPMNAIFASIWFAILAALLNLAGSETFDAIIGLATGAICGTYVLSIGSVIVRRFVGKPLPAARFSLGKLGLPINIISVLYQIELIIFAYFPLFKQVTVTNMNYACVVFGGVVILAMINYWVHGRKVYTGPVVKVRRD